MTAPARQTAAPAGSRSAIVAVCTTHEALHLSSTTRRTGEPVPYPPGHNPTIGDAGEKILAEPQFDGWGYAHLYDAKTSEELDAFAIPESLDERFAAGFGDLSIHEFATDPTENLAYSSYYAGGIRVFQYGRDIGLQQTGAFIDDDGGNFWGIEEFTTPGGERLIAGSDRDFGLQILRYTGPGAAQPPSCSATSASTAPGVPVSVPLTCTDPNGNPLTRAIVAPPGNGTLGPIEGGSVLYTPGSGLTAGTDTFQFAASDGAATSGPATATVTVAAATAAAPETTINKGPKKETTKRKAKFRFTSSAPASSFECKLDKGSFESCTSPFKEKVDTGRHKFQVRATAAGKTDLTPATYRWKVEEKGDKGGK